MKHYPILAMAMTTLLASQALAAGAEYPEYTKKELFAKNDLRGGQAPALQVQSWLTGAAPDTKGKVVLIDFWATWCPPCRALIPELNQYKRKFGDDLVIIGISDEPEARVKTFMEKERMEYNVAVDPSAKMKHEIGISGIPNVLVISPDNVVRWQGFPGVASDRLTEEKISQIITASKAH